MANIAEVVVITRDLHANHLPNTIPVKIADIVSAISTTTNTRIRIIGPSNWTGERVFGTLLRYPDSTPKRADILIKHQVLNRCWQRFVACKEMSHLLIDKDAQFTLDVVALIESFLTQSAVRALDEPLNSEYWAFRCAIEMLVPWKSRSKIVEMIHAGSDNLEIAKAYLVPERIIEYWRSPEYQQAMGEAWEDMEIAHDPIPTQDT